MKAAIYARVNTSNNGQDPTMQTRELREYCERRGWAHLRDEGEAAGARPVDGGRAPEEVLMRSSCGNSTASHARCRTSFVPWRPSRLKESNSSPSPNNSTLHTRGEAGVHCVGGRGGVGALSHRRARADRTAQREGKREVTRTSARLGRRCANRIPPPARSLVGFDR
jgi:hypothetical protein